MNKKLLENPKAIAGIFFLAGIIAPKLLKILRACLKKQPKQQDRKYFVGIELGGTNYSIAIGIPHYDPFGQITGFTLDKTVSGRTNPDCDATVDQIVKFLGTVRYDFIGICSFGPLCLDRTSTHFGSITSTPKPGWKNYPIFQKIKARTNAAAYGFDTDVNAPAYAEFRLGNHHVRESLVYVTVGTGVGIGVIANGKTVKGLMHPEGGHIIVKRHPDEFENFEGVCPFHKDCLEGMVTNNAIAKRLDMDVLKLHELDDDNRVWKLVGYYLAQLCLNLTLILSPEVILLGGGIMNRKVIFQHIYNEFPALLNNYVDLPKLKKEELKHYIRDPKISNVGVIGAMMLKPL